MHGSLNIKSIITGLSIIALLAFSNSCREETFSPSQADSFVKFFGSYDIDTGYDVKSLDDGGYAIVGTTTTENAVTDIILIRTDRYGNEIWEPKLYGGDYNDRAYSFKVLPDGGFAILGTKGLRSNNRLISNLYLIRTNSSGDTIWTREYGGFSKDVGYHLDLTSDGGFIMIGSTEDATKGVSDILIVKTDADGEVFWTRTLGGPGNDVGTHISKTDNGYIFAGYSDSFNQPGQSNSNIFIAKINLLGRVIFPYTYGGSGNDFGESVIPVPGEGYAILGTTTNPLTNTKNIFLTLVEEDIAKPVWSRSFGGDINHVAASLKMTPDGSFIITGTQELSPANHSIFLLKIDGDGNEIFFKTFGGSGRQSAGSVDLTMDGGYVITGSNELGGNSMITLIKTRAGGEL